MNRTETITLVLLVLLLMVVVADNVVLFLAYRSAADKVNRLRAKVNTITSRFGVTV